MPKSNVFMEPDYSEFRGEPNCLTGVPWICPYVFVDKLLCRTVLALPLSDLSSYVFVSGACLEGAEGFVTCVYWVRVGVMIVTCYTPLLLGHYYAISNSYNISYSFQNIAYIPLSTCCA